jgi:hypothetical protein
MYDGFVANICGVTGCQPPSECHSSRPKHPLRSVLPGCFWAGLGLALLSSMVIRGAKNTSHAADERLRQIDKQLEATDLQERLKALIAYIKAHPEDVCKLLQLCESGLIKRMQRRDIEKTIPDSSTHYRVLAVRTKRRLLIDASAGAFTLLSLKELEGKHKGFIQQLFYFGFGLEEKDPVGTVDYDELLAHLSLRHEAAWPNQLLKDTALLPKGFATLPVAPVSLKHCSPPWYVMVASDCSALQVCGDRFKKMQLKKDSVDWHTQGCYVLCGLNNEMEYTKLKHQYLQIEAPCYNTA